MEAKTRKIAIKVFTVFLGFIFFIIGGLIYLTYRSRSLRMFDWADKISANNIVNYLREFAEVHPCNSVFTKFSLPDGLWVISYVLIMSSLWDFKVKSNFIIISLIPFIAILSELLQLFKFIPGVFDIKDLIAYLAAYILGIVYSIICGKLIYKQLM